MLAALLPLAEAAFALSVTGRIRYYGSGEPVPGVSVRLLGTSLRTVTTGADGTYTFDEVGIGSWTIEPQLTGRLENGVSALDATHVLQSVVGKRSFSPAQSLACDVTGDGSISAFDATRILQLVVAKIGRLPVCALCGSDWAFVPAVAAPLPNQQLLAPTIQDGACTPGAISIDALSATLTGQDFEAVLFGDCSGNWQLPTPTPSPPSTATTAFTSSPTPTNTWSPEPSRTPTATPSFSPSATAVPTFTRTLPPTGTNTPVPTTTRTFTRTRTFTATPTATRTLTVTRTHTATPTPTFTRTPLPTSTPPCGSGFRWDFSSPTQIYAHSDGNVWLTKTVPTSSGWGVFWLREDPGASGWARLYYAHVNLAGAVTVAPKLLPIDIPKIPFRGRYYLAAWHTDHYGLLIADRSNLYYHNLSLDGVPSTRKKVGPTLFTSTVYDQESDGDLDPYPQGFLGVIEGSCAGHSCSFAFRLDANGNATSSVYNLVDFDSTHQFYPRSAYDGAGFAILSVKDINITGGGVVTKYMVQDRSPGSRAKVVPAKQYQWDEFPDIAWNGDHYAAIWTENSGRSWSTPWQMHFASFYRNSGTSTLIKNRLLDVWNTKPGQRWTTQIHALGSNWLAQYLRWRSDGEPLAVFEYLNSQAETLASKTPFTVNDDALGSSVHPSSGKIGVARSYSANGSHAITFQTLTAPVCND